MSEQEGTRESVEEHVKDEDVTSTKSLVSRIDEVKEKYEGEEVGGEEEEESEEEEEPRKPKEGKDSIDDLDLDDWYVPSYHSLGYEEYRESFYEGEEEEVGEEKILPLSPVFSTVEPRRVEYDHVFDELHPEADGDREVVIDKLKELHNELADLKRKNKLLEVWTLRCMKKNEQKMTRTDPTKSYEDLEEQYKEVLRVYKMDTEDIQLQQNGLMFEMQNYMNKVQSIRAESYEAFRELLDREKDVAVDLVFEKTGKKVTEKMMNTLTRRQGRRKFIVLKNYLEDLKARLKSVETLGEGMTTMDYEALHVANISYKDKLDERDQELEKLRVKIAKTVNGVAQYKEKEVCLAEDIIVEEKRLRARRDSTLRIREQVNNARMKLKELREDFNEKKIEAGLLVALPELMEMEKKMGLRDNLKKGIDALDREIGLYKRIKKERSKPAVRKDYSTP